MAVHTSFQRQYVSLENVMRDKFSHDFPGKDPTEFQSWFVSDRGRADGSGRRNRYTYDERRWMAEKQTWDRFWPDEDFPGIKPQSGAENAEFNASQSHQIPGYGIRRGTSSMPQTRGRAFGARGRRNYRGRGTYVGTIICRQCGVAGHPELQCPYEIVNKQDLDRERHLICGIPGHCAFRFNSYYGCLECKDEREEPDYNEAVRRSILGSPDKPVQTITFGIKNQSLNDQGEVEFKKDCEDEGGEDGQCLIKF